MTVPVILHPAGEIAWARRRLESLGFALHAFEPDHLTELSHDTVDRVYAMPEEMLQSAGWRKLRVDLARANRLFVGLIKNVSTRMVVRCMRDGAQDVLAEEDPPPVWCDVIQRVVEHQRLWVELYGGRPLRSQDLLVGRSPGLQHLRQNIERIGPTDASVLLLGESGVGKERVASALHRRSGDGPFIALNCAAIPKDLLESELFGVERGAFTGATKSRAGLVEQADGGTLFLDEIGELDLSVQPRLLRFLETREYSVKVRLLSATNRNLDQEISAGRFRSDLYYRLGEIILQLTPLRSRPEDIPDLARLFLRSSNERFGKNFQQLDPDLVFRLQQYSWPGNVRELKSVIDRLVILFDGPVLRSSWWDPPMSSVLPPSGQDRLAGPGSGPPAKQVYELSRPGPRRDAEAKQQQARRLLAESGNRYGWVAAQLGVHPSTLFRWRRLGKV
jgi:DNA-binding NtrC family response regulator